MTPVSSRATIDDEHYAGSTKGVAELTAFLARALLAALQVVLDLFAKDKQVLAVCVLHRQLVLGRDAVGRACRPLALDVWFRRRGGLRGLVEDDRDLGLAGRVLPADLSLARQCSNRQTPASHLPRGRKGGRAERDLKERNALVEDSYAPEDLPLLLLLHPLVEQEARNLRTRRPRRGLARVDSTEEVLDDGELRSRQQPSATPGLYGASASRRMTQPSKLSTALRRLHRLLHEE